MKCLLIVPAFNEGSNVEKVINTIKEKCPQVDYLVVNDCSTDNTKEELGRINASYISGCVNLGIGGAVQCGYKYALKNGYQTSACKAN